MATARLPRSPSPLSLGDPLIAIAHPPDWQHDRHYHYPPRRRRSSQSRPTRTRDLLPATEHYHHLHRLQCPSESMPSPTDDETPFPSLDHSTLHGFGRSHLSPDDAFVSPPRRSGERSRSRRRKRPWKKLMWVKQSCKTPLCISRQEGRAS